jgi:iron complex transport system ATP-binding protein
MSRGRVVADGPPREVLTAERVQEVWGVAVWRGENGATGAPLVLPTWEARR